MHAKCMAVKTITIDMEAYDALSHLKAKGQSFSQVIKTHLARKTGRTLLEALDTLEVSEQALDAVDREIRDRDNHRPRIPTL